MAGQPSAAAPLSNLGTDQDLVELGLVVGVFGLKGWVKVRSHTDPAAAILDYKPWFLASAAGWQARPRLEGRGHGAKIEVRFAGCERPEDAAALVGRALAVPRDQLPEPQEGGHYWFDLIGMEVVNRQGERLGRVERLLATGANDVLVVRGERERLLPWRLGEVITEVDRGGRRLLVDWQLDY